MCDELFRRLVFSVILRANSADVKKNLKDAKLPDVCSIWHIPRPGGQSAAWNRVLSGRRAEPINQSKQGTGEYDGLSVANC